MPECQSTNDEVSRLYADKAEMNGVVVVTDHQTAGRGQRGNTWESEAGLNLTFSVLLKPTFLGVQNQFLLNVISSLALIDFLKDHQVMDVKIKWPNDIYVQSKKISGILIENQINGNKLKTAVVGIGLNVNQEFFDNINATSLKLITNQEQHLSTSLIHLLEKIESRYLMLRSGNFQSLIQTYTQLMYWRGVLHTFVSNNQQFDGIIQGIDDQGQLVIDVEGKGKKFGIKQVVYVK